MKVRKSVIESLRTAGKLSQNEPMSRYTSFKTGGPADCVIVPSSEKAIMDVISLAGAEKIPLTIIGGGTNLLVGDGGIGGIVLVIASPRVSSSSIRIENEGLIYANAAVAKKDFIQFAIENGYGGIEFMTGIPGVIGGGVLMNAGTDRGSFSDILHSVTLIDHTDGLHSVPVTGDIASYRNLRLAGGAVVTGAYFSLPRADSPEIVAKLVRDILSEREKKHPLEYPSAGSVFKNPEGYSSWKLIDEAGLKGKSVGGAAISDLHTNFIINRSGATSQDIRTLIELVQERVEKIFGVHLETEIKMLGEF